MTENASLAWKLGIAGISMMTAIGVYIFARANPPCLFEPFNTTNSFSTDLTWLFGSAPSLFYTLSIGLLIGACTTTRFSAILHCLLWISLALILELSQQAEIVGLFLGSPLEPDSYSVWGVARLYWSRGAFDPIDLIATIVGGLLALGLLASSAIGRIYEPGSQ